LGSNISSTIAEIYLQLLEEICIEQWPEIKEIISYKRYIDAILINFDQNKTDGKTILTQLNNIDKQEIQAIGRRK
jgi:hypothetical protein